MNELEIIEKAAKKMAELEKSRDNILAKLQTKASQEEVDTLRASLEEVSTAIVRLNEAISSHTTIIESLTVDGQQELPVEDPDNIDLARLSSSKARKDLSRTFNTSFVQFKKFIKKAINAPYISSNVSTEGISFLNQRLTPSLVDIFYRQPAQSPTLRMLFFEMKIVGGGSSNTSGCFLPPETDIDLSTKDFNATTYRGWTKVCDTAIEDYNNMMEAIYELMSQIIGGHIDTSLYTAISTNSSLVTSMPSWISMAASIPECTLYDVIATVSMDIVNISLGKYRPDYVLLNPVDSIRLFTDKTVATHLDRLGVEGFGLPKIFLTTTVPAGSFYVIDSSIIGYYPVRGLNVSVATQNDDDFKRGILTIRADERGIITDNGLGKFGMVTGNIANAIANYNKP